MKKVLICIVVSIIIATASFMFIVKNSNKLASAYEEAEIVKSLEETKKEKKKLEQLLTKGFQQLNENGYEQIGLSYTNQNLTVQVPDEAFLEANKINIEKIIHTTAKKIGFQDFKVEFLTMDSYPTLSEEDEITRESMMNVLEEMSVLLKDEGYDYYSIATNPNNEIVVEIQETKEDLKKFKEIEELIAQKILSQSNMDLDIKIRKKSKSAILDQEWQPILDAIREETEKKFAEYRGFAYSFHPEPLQIIIKTNIDSPKWFGNSDKKINQMTEYVDKIIQLKREELSIEKIPYEIIIRDKDDKKIN